MLPVALSLLGLGLRPITWLFMKWFGPRGLASVLFTLVALEELESGSRPMPPWSRWQPGPSCCPLVAHGVSAGPLAAQYGARTSALGDVPETAL